MNCHPNAEQIHPGFESSGARINTPRFKYPQFARDMRKLVRALQREEGNFECFGTANAGECDQQQCRWRSHCFLAATSD